MQEKQPEESGGDMLDSITDFFEDSGRTRKQVAKKLKQMKLITDIRQVTKKPLKTKGAPWTDEEIETLTRLYKVPFIYYISTCISQNLIWVPNFSQKLIFRQNKRIYFSTLQFDEIFML